MNLTPALKLYAGYRRKALAGLDPVRAQEREWSRLVARASGTRFGVDHGFASLRSIADFQKAVPLRRYDDFWKSYWKPAFPVIENVTWPGRVPYFAVTSGTTSGASKFIPVTPEMNQANARAGLDLLTHHVTARPHSQVFGGKSFMLGGSTDLVREADNVWSGDLSGIAVKRLPWWAKGFAFPPLEIALLTDWEEKLNRVAELSMKTDIRVLTGTPSWLLILFDKLSSNAGRKVTARDVYPHLDLLIHGGVNFKPYRARFEEFLAGGAELREVYPASEGFIAMQDETPAHGLRLCLDNGIFFEFVPLEELDSAQPTRHWIGTVEPGVNYAIVLSTCSGVWSYVIGDTVRFVGTNPHRILITGRTSYSMSAFGEHLIGEEVEDAVAAAAQAISASVTDFSMGAVFPSGQGELGGHVYVVEFAQTPAPAAVARFAAVIDETLQRRNDDYRAHRAEGFGMKAPAAEAVQPGSFAAWMKQRGRLGGQNKVPRIINDQELFASLRAFSRP
jgi:hypothetical protein